LLLTLWTAAAGARTLRPDIAHLVRRYLRHGGQNRRVWSPWTSGPTPANGPTTGVAPRIRL